MSSNFIHEVLIKVTTGNDALWQRPLNNFIEDELWYSRQPLGHNTLNELMKIISISACLHQIYTNHHIRATTITLLDSAAIEARHIMRTSGHKSEASIRSYSSRMNDCQKQNISDVEPITR